MGEMLRVLEAFQQQASRRITGMMTTRESGREWEYPLVVEALEAAGLHPIME